MSSATNNSPPAQTAAPANDIVDSLSPLSRAFYERSKAKLAVSIVLGASCLMLLGFCSNSGGQVSQCQYCWEKAFI